MNRVEFGQLLATLRQDLGWTQFKLAEVADIDEAVVSQVERGVKRFLAPDLLFALANALQLTTLERREFVLAACGLEKEKIVRQAGANVKTDVFNSRKVLEKLVDLCGSVRLPAFVVDVYSDVIAVNNAMVAFYEISPELLATAAQVLGGFNTMRVNYGKELIGRNRILENWENYALNSMRSFRANTLRYRTKPYFKHLIKIFRDPIEYPLFERYWNLVSSLEQDKDASIDIFSYHHPRFGDLNYIATPTTALTSYGELFLVQNLPLDEHTEQVFGDLLKAAGVGTLRFSSWPEKPIPQTG